MSVSDEQLRDLCVAVTLAPRLGHVIEPADPRVLLIVARRYLHAGRACGMAAYEWAAIGRAARQLAHAESAARDAMAARRAAAAEAARPTFISSEAPFAAELVADVGAGPLAQAGSAG